MRRRIGYSLVLYLACASSLWAQSAFTNLDFESARLVPIPNDPYGSVYLSTASPGWRAFSGTNQMNSALYDDMFLDSTGIAIVDANSPVGGLIQGNCTVVLQAGNEITSGPSVPADASLSQTGLVPLGTKSLSFLAGTNGPFVVSLGGVALNLISSPVPNHYYSLYAADVSAFAGQTTELKFMLFAESPHVNNRFLSLDSIQFSSAPIPEPSASSLLLAGIAGLVFWRRRTCPKTA